MARPSWATRRWGAVRTALDGMGSDRASKVPGSPPSTRGVQYASAAYQQLLADAGFTASMSRVGDCWDNRVVESFFATITKELLVDGLFETRAAASRALFEFIEIWYNRQRWHSTLGCESPVEFEEQLQQASYLRRPRKREKFSTTTGHDTTIRHSGGSSPKIRLV